MYTLTKRAELETATWAGGTTTQLAIYPAAATYKEFNFDYRISYATVEAEESTFTFMPGVTRHLMILKGELEIDHTGRYKKRLRKFDTDMFSGEWPTTAKGKVTDFNLMTRGNTSGELEAIMLREGKELLMQAGKKNDRTSFYLLEGDLQLRYSGESISLHEGDFILFAHTNGQSIVFNAVKDCEVIAAKVRLG